MRLPALDEFYQRSALPGSKIAVFTTISVPAPQETEGTPLHGEGWTLELSAGWIVRPAERDASYILEERSR